MKIAISGATGFIGTHLTAHLTGLGHRAVPLGRSAFRSQESLAAALAELKLEPYIVSESAGTQAEDALAMKECYRRIFSAQNE